MKKIIVCLILFLLIVPGMAWGQYSNAPRGSGGGTPYDSNPAMDGAAAPGDSDAYARGNHVHPSDTTRVPFSQAATTLTADSATPALTAGKYYYVTANTGATTYTNFTGGAAGQRIIIKVADNNSVFDFTSTNLTRAEGTDYTAVSGDVIDAIFDGTNWYCKVWGVNAADGSRKAVFQNNTSISATASAYEIYFNAGAFTINSNGTAYPATYTVASGTATLGTDAIASGDHATVVSVAATGVATTDVIDWGFNSDPHGVTGYAPSANGMLTIIAYPSSGYVNFLVLNNTASSITPGSALTLNWKVRR